MKNGAITYFMGVLFALGLGASGMVQPQIVRGFLDIAGTWDWRLLGVMVGAISIHAIAYRLIRKRPAPILDSEFHIPQRRDINAKLLVGATLFGLGWGWAGICPGPSIVGLASGDKNFFFFVLAMIAGMKTFQLIFRR